MELANPLLLGYVDGRPIYQGDKSRLCCLLTDIERVKKTIKIGEVVIQGFLNHLGKDVVLGLKIFDCTTFKASLYNIPDQLMTQAEIKSESDIKLALLRDEYKSMSDEQWKEYLDLIYHCIDEILKFNTRARQNQKLKFIYEVENLYSRDRLVTFRISYQSRKKYLGLLN